MTTDLPILIAADVVADAELVSKLLREEFGSLAVSIGSDRIVEDFQACKPAVLILAFRTVEKAESYYLGLYRLGTAVHSLPHRTVILCHKDDVARVYTLCRQEYFDDYVVFWTPTPDAPRLPMAVHQALRRGASDKAGAQTASQVAAQAGPLAKLGDVLDQHAARGAESVENVGQSVRQAEKSIVAALDGFSHKLSKGGHPDALATGERDELQQEIRHLIAEEVGMRFQTITTAVEPLGQLAGALKQDLAPQLESARLLQSLVDKVRPLIVIVDDDEFQHKLLAKALKELDVEIIFCTLGMKALALMYKRRPDLVLMDRSLPDIDGVEATRRIKAAEQLASVPVIMLTGHGERSVIIESVKAGAVDFIVKPFDKKMLLAKVRKSLYGT